MHGRTIAPENQIEFRIHFGCNPITDFLSFEPLKENERLKWNLTTKKSQRIKFNFGRKFSPNLRNRLKRSNFLVNIAFIRLAQSNAIIFFFFLRRRFTTNWIFILINFNYFILFFFSNFKSRTIIWSIALQLNANGLCSFFTHMHTFAVEWNNNYYVITWRSFTDFSQNVQNIFEILFAQMYSTQNETSRVKSNNFELIFNSTSPRRLIK